MRIQLQPLVCAVVVVSVALSFYGLTQVHQTPVLHVAGARISLDVVDTPAARQQGLSGRGGLADNSGMLFVFNENSADCFWMKDMQFSIDILWLNEAKQVLYSVQNVDPASYPHSFCPPEPARYVIELPAGRAGSLGIRDGQTLDF